LSPSNPGSGGRGWSVNGDSFKSIVDELPPNLYWSGGEVDFLEFCSEKMILALSAVRRALELSTKYID